MRDPYPPAPVLALGAGPASKETHCMGLRVVAPECWAEIARLREISQAYERIAKGIDAIPGRKPLSDRMEVGE